jgi:hypothetical protein
MVVRSDPTWKIERVSIWSAEEFEPSPAIKKVEEMLVCLLV